MIGDSYHTNCWKLSYGEDVGHINEPPGHQRPPIIHKVGQNEACRFVAECPIPRYGNAEKRHRKYCVTHTQSLEHLPFHWWRQCCLQNPTNSNAFAIYDGLHTPQHSQIVTNWMAKVLFLSINFDSSFNFISKFYFVLILFDVFSININFVLELNIV